ncbi:MAS protein, partial [Scopus umbretta]|nr:MAS protein [Scopus umbretta]
ETITTDLYMASGYVSYGERTENECLILSQGLMVFPIVCMGISFCGLVGNGLVMWFLGSHMKQNPFIVYILNLAVADFSLLLLFFLVLLAILSFTAICTYLPSIMDLYMFIFFVAEFLCHFFDLSSLGLLTAISMERCISVL